MYKKVFLDANIAIDIFDDLRKTHSDSVKSIQYLNLSNLEFFTSCDLITTIYYVISKKDKKLALDVIENISILCKVIDFSNKEVELCCEMMKDDERYKDFEDTLQYLLAKKVGCDLILSNDKSFYSPDIELLSTHDLAKKFKL